MIHIHTGAMDISGSNTGFILLAAEAFGISPDKVRLINGDTDNAPYATGTGGSKMTYATGKAVIAAAREARQQVLAVAAEEFEAAVEDLEIVDGEVRVKGVPSKTMSLGEIAEKTMSWGDYAPIHGTGRTVVTDQSPAFNAQLIEVAVDRETGSVQVLRLISAQDAGRAINPLAIEGQIMGGSTQGIGWALYEKIIYDGDGQLLTGSWMDYTVPDSMQAAQEMETIILEVPSEHGPFGARGVGEPPIIPTAAAIANAIAHATGARMTEIPMTAPKVLNAVQEMNNN
jgi:CO/xanthine dehydrogenase Mo-binding subunit